MTNQKYEDFRTEVITDIYYKGAQKYEIPLDLKFSQGDIFNLTFPVGFGITGTTIDFYSNEKYHVFTLVDTQINDNGKNISLSLNETQTNNFIPGIITAYVKNSNTGTHYLYLIGECFKGFFNQNIQW